MKTVDRKLRREATQPNNLVFLGTFMKDVKNLDKFKTKAS